MSKILLLMVTGALIFVGASFRSTAEQTEQNTLDLQLVKKDIEDTAEDFRDGIIQMGQMDSEIGSLNVAVGKLEVLVDRIENALEDRD